MIYSYRGTVHVHMIEMKIFLSSRIVRPDRRESQVGSSGEECLKNLTSCSRRCRVYLTFCLRKKVFHGRSIDGVRKNDEGQPFAANFVHLELCHRKFKIIF